jgi:histidinol-phosphatase
MAEDLATLLEFARQIAVTAGKITLRYFSPDIPVELKPDESPVTAADRESEEYLRSAILGRYPEHAVLGEEAGLSGPADAEYRWVLDPIDGTRSFVRGVPLYGVLVGLLHRGVPVVGVVHLPVLDETVSAAQGLGCTWNGSPCRVSSRKSLREGLLVASVGRAAEASAKADAFARVLAAAGTFRTWGDCYGYVLVATGRAEAAIDPLMNIWDAAALLPILQEAGGSYTDWQGNPTVDGGEGIGTNGHVLPELLALVKG